jgi:2,4-dienoyl-CoA reductase-like NADH-dependent reductase (Old Yellow Enzyme family)
MLENSETKEASYKLVRVPSLRTVEDFKRHLSQNGIELPCDDVLEKADTSPLAKPVESLVINGKQITNRIVAQPMEGWDATPEGGPSPETMRRWQRFGESGAKIIFGGEAMAIRPDAKSNPHQLLLNHENLPGLIALKKVLVEAHRQSFGCVDDLAIGFQLTHGGRFARPFDHSQPMPRVAFRHPLLDARTGVKDDSAIMTDAELGVMIGDFVRAARIAYEAGADFVDIKHCHGYLLHEFLGAHTRPGPYGGSFENRTRLLREIVAGIRADGNPIDLAVRVSVFDMVPFQPDPARTTPNRLGPGQPMDYSRCLPYRYGFGMNPDQPLQYDLSEPCQFMDLCIRLGVKIVNVTGGAPYYNPHIQRPAAYPPCDGYQPFQDPLLDVARQIQVTRQIKAHVQNRLVLIGSAYSYLQEYLPHVAQAVVRQGWVDMVGLGRMLLSYPRFLADVLEKCAYDPRMICRTFSDCTTGPRRGMISGCYPLDKYYSVRPEFQKIREFKKSMSAAT